jgi:hypothetical protein
VFVLLSSQTITGYVSSQLHHRLSSVLPGAHLQNEDPSLSSFYQVL